MNVITNHSKASSAAVGLALVCVLLSTAGGASAAPARATGHAVAQTRSEVVCDYFYGDRPTISYGSSGPIVKQAQCELNGVIHAGLAVDGAFGRATENATKEFQMKCGLVKDGIIGPKTWARLNDIFYYHARC
ncbi:peptidoglycan-binding protein [Streptomyces sp. TP-A0356]|uniref:peptidoglycan-binding domain-containing protein n=1 Tax=Streptomyces sp. TP-A0356 TaxID=1359208 RepID=UPI0006E3B1D8|nr:peptidoglycan-binding domain-containing protein [Streptomyces sp. TP-A0356]